MRGMIAALGIAGGILGGITGVLVLLFEDLGVWAAAGGVGTAKSVGVVLLVLGLLALVAAVLAERHSRATRGLYLVAVVLGFLVGGVLWIPAGVLLVLAGVSRVVGCVERPSGTLTAEESGADYFPAC